MNSSPSGRNYLALHILMSIDEEHAGVNLSDIPAAVHEDLGVHLRFMREALHMAEKALALGETPVGCVIVHEGEIVGSGMNDTNKSLNGSRHAEFLAITEVLSSHPPSILQLADLYVTVEPCIMCASALRQYGIRNVFFGCGNERFGGTGTVLSIHSDTMLHRPYPSYGGLYRKEAINILRRFYIQENEKAPQPRPKRQRELNLLP
jgi:tRNA-specific adenosine deaminase 2